MQLHRTTTTTTKSRTLHSQLVGLFFFFQLSWQTLHFPVYVRNVDYARTRAVDADVMMMLLLLLLHAVSFPATAAAAFIIIYSQGLP